MINWVIELSLGRLRHARVAVPAGVGVLILLASASAGESVADIFDQVHRSVVMVRTKERDIGDEGRQRVVSISGFGSGVLISQDGKVLTAAHLVDAASEISVEFGGGERIRARVAASEPDADVALLQVDRAPADATVARLADSVRARVGERVFVVGAPYGITHTLTVGHISWLAWTPDERLCAPDNHQLCLEP